jgi:3-oxoadipate enol-lactonase
MRTVELYYTVDGPAEAPPLVLGASLGTDTTLWCPQLPSLAGRLRVIRYDHRGHGRSPVPAGPYRIDQLGADLLALLDRLGLARVHLGGLSLGGMVGMWLAAHAPHRVDRLVLLCTAARLGPAQAWAERAAMVRAHGMAAIADAGLARWFTPGFAERHPRTVARWREVLLGTPAEGYAACCEAIQVMDLLPVLPRIQAPTLVIAAREDPATPPEHAERIAAAIPGARLELLADAAHLANLAQPERVSRLVLKFLEACERNQA